MEKENIMGRIAGSSNKGGKKVQMSFRLDQSYFDLIVETKNKHNLRTYTEALEYLLREKAIELAIEEASLD